MDSAGVTNITETSKALIRCLQNDLYVSDVGLVDGLIEEGYLSADDWQAIHGVFRNKKKVKILIKSLAKCSNPCGAFKCLLDKLKISHGHLVQSVQRILENSEKTRQFVGHHPDPVENDDTCVSAHREVNNNVILQNPSNTYRREATENSFHEPCSHNAVNAGRADIGKRAAEWNDSSVNIEYPVYETCIGSNGQEATEHSWYSDTNSNIHRQCQLIRKSKKLDFSQSEEVRNRITLQNWDQIRIENQTGNRNSIIPHYASTRHRSATEHSYGLDEVDTVVLNSNEGSSQTGMETSIHCVDHMKYCSRHAVENGFDGCVNHGMARLTVHDDSETICHQNKYKTPLINKEHMVNARRYYQPTENNNNALWKDASDHAYDAKVEGCIACYNERKTKVLEQFDEENFAIRDVQTTMSEAREGVCRKCMELRRGNMQQQSSNHFSKSNASKRNMSGNLRNGRKRYSIEIVLSSSSSSESEMNTEVSTSDLDGDERKMFSNIMSDGISDVVDECIQSGMLSCDDYNLIHGTSSNRKKKAILTRLLSETSQQIPKELETNSTQAGTKREISGFDEVDSIIVPCENTKKHVMSIALNILPESGQVVIKNLDVVFDKFNTMLNDGALKVDDLPDDYNIQCIVHYLHACDNLYRYNFEVAKTHIKTADSLLPCTDYPEQLRCEIFTAKTWLSLQTKKLGKMLRLLEENEQSMKSFPEHWPSKAKGWFYYDYCRCYEALLKRMLFQGTRVRNGNENTAEWYRQSAIKCAKRAIDYFRISTSSDGPIGTGFALCQMADLHLLFYPRTPVREITISIEDLKNADTAIKSIENLPGGIPDVLKASYLVAKCSYQVRSGDLDGALVIAKEAFELSERLDLRQELGDSQFMIDQLESWPREPFVVKQNTYTVSSAGDSSDMTESE